MNYLIDTDVAIHLRDGSPEIVGRITALESVPAISVVTLVELQAGAALDRSSGGLRTALLSRLRETLSVFPFDEAEADAYGEIVAATGHDRRRVLDRMIAAQAIVAGRTLITINARDFADIPGLMLRAWPAPVA
ncbi:MAG: PIN domain-containing protein [Novosphingobium sp.]